ncbi:MAG: hypothetical protein QNK37_34465 [Acidobacteriota bacterium]|nr:hypothetical protein [Acidobacteriota bacterium]
MQNSRQQWITRLLVSLVLLGNLLGALPELHHHEHEHACLQEDGTFFYVEIVDAHPDDEHHGEPCLAGARLGDAHDHDHCVLCQLARSSATHEQLAVTYRLVSSVAGEYGPFIQPNDGALYHLSRGPPAVPLS